MMSAMGTMRGSRSRWLALGVAIAAVVVVIAIAASPSASPGRDLPGASGRPSDPPAAIGPIVYYEVLDAAGSHLMERRLDGRSLARVVATRTDVDFGRTWIVDPAGALAIALVPGPDDQQLGASSIATGAAVWSTDGTRVALASVGGDGRSREAIVVDASSGRSVQAVIPDDAIVQGFDATGGLILRQRLPSRQGVEVGWQFSRLDPASGATGRLTALPDVGPASDWSEDVDPAVGLAVDTTIGANDQGTAIRLWPLRGGPSRVLTTLPSVDRIAIDPGGTGVAISAAQTIRYVAFDGGASELFTGPDPIADFGWSTDGDYLAVATDRHGPNLTIVERATGRSLELPHPDVVAQLLLVRIVGGVPLPAVALPPAEPTPSPTPAPSGPDVAGFGGLLAAWVDRDGDHQVVRVQRLAPTEAGGLRVAADMPPLDLGPVAVPDDGGPELQLLPRPGSRDILVWVGLAERSTGWLWDGATGLQRLELPSDWPAYAYDVAWRPDGRALAASAGRASDDGAFEGIFVIAEPGGRTTTALPIVGDYDRLEGWWSPIELRVGHGICTEGCEGRYAYSARLGIRSRQLVEMTPDDRSHAPIDEVAVDPGRSTIVLSMINDDPADDIVVTWPADRGPLDGLSVLGFGAGGRSLFVTEETATGTDLSRIEDPVGRAVAGRLADPGPVGLLHLDGRGLRLDVSPDGGWAIVFDRVDNVRLVRLADGRSWAADRDRLLVWADRG